ncbi:MAG: hypothetical protein Q4P35_03915 [Clostridia bacterium]|nr:hypothetical protein [Clostridia bacterium]
MMTSIKMLLSYNNNEKIVQLPVVPDTLPNILQEIENSTLTTHTTTLTLLGSKKPRSFSLELFLPTRDYEFCKGNGLEVIEFLEYVSSAKIPARLVIVDNLTEILNIAIAINSYKYNYDTVKNIRATIECSEYIFLTEPKKETTTSVPVFSNITVYYNNKAARVSSANVNGSNLVKTRDIVMLLGRDLTWNADKKRVGCGKVLLDIHTEIYDGNAYSYIRDIASILGLEVEYDAEEKSVTLKDGES